MFQSEWYNVNDEEPFEGSLVEVVTPGDNVKDLKYSGGLWWLPDMSIYVYFVPVKWRYKDV